MSSLVIVVSFQFNENLCFKVLWYRVIEGDISDLYINAYTQRSHIAPHTHVFLNKKDEKTWVMLRIRTEL